DCDLTGVAGFTEQMRRAHRRAGAQVLTARTVDADGQVSRALQLPPGAPVYELVRVRSADGTALALERTWLPADRLPRPLGHPLTGSIYELLADEYGLAPHTAVEYLEPVSADPATAAALGVVRGTPLMGVERTAHSVGGLAVEYARDLYRADKVRLMVRTEVRRDDGERNGAAGVSEPPRHRDRPRPGGERSTGSTAAASGPPGTAHYHHADHTDEESRGCARWT